MPFILQGVLQGERARFQLFGDTVNTASRMESSGVPGKIQVSVFTAELLRKAGKEHWLQRRDDPVVAKGKGVLETYFLFPKSKASSSTSSQSDDEANNSVNSFIQNRTPASPNQLSATCPRYGPAVDIKRQDRLVDWIVEQLLRRFRKVHARHEKLGIVAESDEQLIYKLPAGSTSMDEIVEVIPMPKYDSATNVTTADVQVDPVVASQLKKVVKTISLLYKDNPFHNFEHAW